MLRRPCAPRAFPGNRRPGGFTLVELLVVIGIIAVLVSILLPSLNRAREAANQTKCLSNLRQLGMAFQMYLNENKGAFPYSGRYDIPKNEDWLWWQETPYAGRVQADIRQSAIAKYLAPNGNVNADFFRCPSDDLSQRPAALPGGQYLYSYSMNYFLEDSPYDPVAGYKAPRLSSIKNTSDKIILVEEDAYTAEGTGINDGAWVAPAVNYGDPSYVNNTTGNGDLLSIRHDGNKAKPDAGWKFPDIPNKERRGNVNFIDGHAEFVSRMVAHDLAHVDPNFN